MSLLGELERAALPAAADLGVLRLVTAGSVDDGKSTLIGRLLHDSRAILEDQLAALANASARRGHAGIDLSLLTDGLEAEREQGITIDVAYRYFATGRRTFILADAPGHEQYTRNMVTGASTADVAVILIDARKGVLPQTRRHTYIAHALGIRHIFVAVNKMDLVAYDRAVFERVRADFEGFAAPLGIPDLRFLPISALRGDWVVTGGEAMAWHTGVPLLEALETLEVQDEADALPFRFPVQLVVRGDHSDFRGYAGRVASGTVAVGDEVVVLPAGRRTTVREIVTLEAARTGAVAGDSVTLRLADDIDLARGDLIGDPRRAPSVSRSVQATVCWFDDEPLRTGARYLLKHGTRTLPARVTSVAALVDVHTFQHRPANAPLGMNDIARVALTVSQPLAFDTYAENRATGSFILIDAATHRTVAAGMIEQP
jgi:sulfate adenylyltransferase large subunit